MLNPKDLNVNSHVCNAWKKRKEHEHNPDRG